MLVPFEDNETMYASAFEQTGYGMPRYRGSPMIGGSFWGRIIGFAKGLFSKAAPHISNLIAQAQPHVKKVASHAIESAIDNAVAHVNEKLKKKIAQSGEGRKRKRIKNIAKRIKNPTLKNSKIPR